MLATVVALYNTAGLGERREGVLWKRLAVLGATTSMILAAMLMALAGAALAQPGGGPDVCVSIKGDTKVDKGESTCFSNSTSKAVAVKGSYAVAYRDSRAHAVNDSLATADRDSRAHAVNNSFAIAYRDSRAHAVNNSSAFAFDDSRAHAVNNSFAFAWFECVATAQNGEVEDCE